MGYAILFAIVKEYRQTKWPNLSNWLNKIWFAHTVEYSTAVEKNEGLYYSMLNLKQFPRTVVK